MFKYKHKYNILLLLIIMITTLGCETKKFDRTGLLYENCREDKTCKGNLYCNLKTGKCQEEPTEGKKVVLV